MPPSKQGVDLVDLAVRVGMLERKVEDLEDAVGIESANLDSDSKTGMASAVQELQEALSMLHLLGPKRPKED